MPQAGAPPPSDDSSLRAIVVRVAGAVTTGIGVLGFVALVGGADYWLRFSSSGLPADETVADLSRNQLLVVGARELFPFLVIAVVEVVLLYLLEQTVKGRIKVRLLARVAHRLQRSRTPDDVEDTRKDLIRVRVALSLVAIPVAVVAHALLAERDTFASLALIAVVATGLALMVALYAAASASSSFTKFVLAALAASAVFALVSAASRTSEAPDVRPVALVLDGKPLAGIYVSASTDHVFVGEVCAERPGSQVGNATTGSLMDLPRKDISLMLIGSNARLEDAITREQSLLTALPRLTSIKPAALAAVAPPPPSTTGGVACTGPSAASLVR